MLATMIAALAAVCSSPAADVCARLPNSELQISITAPGYRRADELIALLSKADAEQALLVGEIEPAGTTLIVFASLDRPHRTGEQWRAENTAGEGLRFKAGDIACRTLEQELSGGATGVRFDAWIVAAGFVFDVRVTALVQPGTASFAQRDFEKLAASLRVAYARLGEPTNLPRDVRDAQHRAFLAHPNERATLKQELARKPDDAALAFASAELLVFAGGTASEVLAAHSRALELLTKLRTPTTEQRFAWMLAEEAVGLALGAQGKFADALAHARKSLEIAGQLRSRARPALAYEAARAAAQAGDANSAVTLLNEAIEADVQWRTVARADTKLAVLAGDKRFQALTR